jgi:tRNA-Thr(GGU) m(6)t(6)A37 methyltransferase TsaA
MIFAMDASRPAEVVPIGRVHSSLVDPAEAPKQGHEGAPDARIEILPAFVEALDAIEPGDEIVLLTWFHRADREVLKVHPRDDPGNPLTGVFATRSADRPNPIGLHRVEVLEIEDDGWLTVPGLEAIDGTPVIDIKPVLEPPGF